MTRESRPKKGRKGQMGCILRKNVLSTQLQEVKSSLMVDRTEWQILVQYSKVSFLGKCSFSMAAIRNHHKCSSLKHCSFITPPFYKFGGHVLPEQWRMNTHSFIPNSSFFCSHSMSNPSENLIGSSHIQNLSNSLNHLHCHHPGPLAHCFYTLFLNSSCS